MTKKTIQIWVIIFIAAFGVYLNSVEKIAEFTFKDFSLLLTSIIVLGLLFIGFKEEYWSKNVQPPYSKSKPKKKSKQKYSPKIINDSQGIKDKIELGKYFYLINYSDYYSDFLDKTDNKKKIIAELFVFRAWLTQMGFRIFSSQPKISEEIGREVFNQGKSIGNLMLKENNQVDLEEETKMKYVDLIDSRWSNYDKIFIGNKNSENPIPAYEICGKLMDYCKIKNPKKLTSITLDFIKTLERIKQEAIESKLLD